MSSLAYMKLDYTARFILERALAEVLGDAGAIPEELDKAVTAAKEQESKDLEDALDLVKSQLGSKMDSLQALAKDHAELQEAIAREQTALEDLLDTLSGKLEDYRNEQANRADDIAQAVTQFEAGFKDLDVAEDLVQELDIQGVPDHQSGRTHAHQGRPGTRRVHLPGLRPHNGLRSPAGDRQGAFRSLPGQVPQVRFGSPRRGACRARSSLPEL